MTAAAVETEELPVREGQVLDGKFRVERIIGEGAMGLVVEATHLALDERVALKFLRREAKTQPEVAGRFAREARAAVKIKSDHVARVFDVGTTEDGTPYIVMEFLEGSDLATILEVRRHLDISEAVEYVIQACEGLTEAHARGIVHRDIKPENLFLAQGAGAMKQIKLLDFGISKAALGGTGLESDLASNHTTQIMGSPHYMSPDQLRSTRDVDGRADIWSLGVVLFELLAGQMPFTATEVTALIAQILHDPHQRLTALRSDIPVELEAVVDKCLSKDLTQRYQTAADVAIALLPFAPKRARAIVEKAADIARSAGGTAVLADLDSLPPPPMSASRSKSDTALGPTVTAATAPDAPQRNGPGAAVWVIAGIVLLAGIGAGVAALMSGGQQRTTGGAAPATSTGPASTAGGWASIPGEASTATGTATGAGAAAADTPDARSPSSPTARGNAAAGNPAGRPAQPFRPVVTAPQAPTSAKPAAAPAKPGETDIRLER